LHSPSTRLALSAPFPSAKHVASCPCCKPDLSRGSESLRIQSALRTRWVSNTRYFCWWSRGKLGFFNVRWDPFCFSVFWLTPWSWALLEKPPVVQLLENFPTFYGNWRCSQEPSHWSLFWAWSVRSVPPHPITLRSILMLSRFTGCDCRLGMGWILDLLTRLGTTSNYSAIADLHTLQFTTIPAKPFPARCVFNSRSLAMASNSGDSSASRAQVLLWQPPMQNSCHFPQLSTQL
jgi:hypothetical protein